MRKEADDVNFLHGGTAPFRAGQRTVFSALVHGGGTVFTAVVIREGDNVQPFDGRHTRNIGRCHVIISTWGKAGVQMEVIIEPES